MGPSLDAGSPVLNVSGLFAAWVTYVSELRIGFALCSSAANPLPSTRIAALNMLPFLRSAGFATSILFEPPEPTETPDLTSIAEKAIELGCEVVVLQKIRGSSAVTLARRLASVGIRTIFLVCDRIDIPMVEATDATIVVTDFLKSLYPVALQKHLHVVHDGIEQPKVHKMDWGTHNSRLEAVLITSEDLDHLPLLGAVPPWMKMRIVGRYQRGLPKLRGLIWKWNAKSNVERVAYLRFLMDKRIDCIPWDPEGVYKELLQADVGCIPIQAPVEETIGTKEGPVWLRKSENRLTLMMAIGLPVIATPIPAYEAVIEHGRNGFLAKSLPEWHILLGELRDPNLRRDIGIAARVSVEDRFSMAAQAARFIRVVNGLIL